MDLRQALEEATGSRGAALRPARGGDVCEACCAELADGHRIFVKTRGNAPRVASLSGPPEPPARLHGDLWSGNVMAAPGG